MAVDREKILQAAQKYVDKKKYARAISEYQKLLVGNPNDARTLLKIGDLQARTSAYGDAVATYDRVGHYYSSQGFALKAVAVYKQIRELLEKYVPELTERYSHIIPKLAEIYAELGLLTEALGAYEEVIARALNHGKEREALDVLRKMAGLDANNPLRHIRYAEASCRLQELDEAIEAFGVAAELLIGAGHRDDALKVLERMLHFRQEPRFARLAAENYLDRGGLQDGLLALGKLQICFQADPHDLGTLELLARVFSIIDQGQKAIEVRKEMARIAFEQGHYETHREIVDALLLVASDDPQVQALDALHERSSARVASGTAEAEEIDADDVLDEADVSEISVTSIIEGLDQDLAARTDLEDHTGSEPLGPDAIEDHSQVVEEIGYAEATDAETHAERATQDAEKFRELGLYPKAIETLRIAIELDPRSIALREHLIEILAEASDREGTIQEMVALSTLHVELGDTALAQNILEQVLEAEPHHPEASELLAELGSGGASASRQAGLESALPTYDSGEGTDFHSSSVDTAIIEGVPSRVTSAPSAPGDNFEPAPKSGLVASKPPQDNSIEALESALEEADFYASCGLTDDAKRIVRDLWGRFPEHPLLVERMNELGVVPPKKGSVSRSQPAVTPPTKQASDDFLTFDNAEESAAENEVDVALGDAIDLGQEASSEEGAAADGATHYELGIAYKDMGLFDEAISEFEQAAKDRAHECASQYELGLVYELTDNKEESLYCFKKAARRDPKYRDVQKKIQSLEPSPGKAKPSVRVMNEDDEFDKAFDDMFKD